MHCACEKTEKFLSNMVNDQLSAKLVLGGRSTMTAVGAPAGGTGTSTMTAVGAPAGGTGASAAAVVGAPRVQLCSPASLAAGEVPAREGIRVG